MPQPKASHASELTMNLLIRYLRACHTTLYFTPVLLAGGCAVFSAATLPEVRGQTNNLLQLSYENCPAQQNTAEFAIPTELLNILYTKGADAFKGYLERKSSRFSVQYTASTTVDDFSPGRCLRLRRIDPRDQNEMMDLFLEIRRRGANAVEISPVSLTVRRFAASTSPINGSLKARLTVSMGLSFVNPRSSGQSPITELNLPIGSVVYELGKSPPSTFSGQTSKLFPDLSGIPVNVTVVVSEAGNGSEVFDDAVKGFEENSESLMAIIGQLKNN